MTAHAVVLAGGGPTGPVRVFTLLHEARAVLLDLGRHLPLDVSPLG